MVNKPSRLNSKFSRVARLILHDVGLLLHIPGIMALISIPICLWFGEFYALRPFLETAIASFIPAQILYRFCSPKVDATRLYHAMIIAALGWGLISLIGAIPFLGVATRWSAFSATPETILAFQNGWNALFESFSGFTGTGLSVAQDASVLPHSLQWWRSLTEWVDGVGIIILVLSVNVGLSMGISDPNLHWGGKLILIVLMWLGQLEIIPVLLLVLSLLCPVSPMMPLQKSK